jgi:hypothetical protein
MVDPKPLAKPLTENEASVIHAVATLVMSWLIFGLFIDAFSGV